MINETPDIEVGGETGYLTFKIKSADTGGMTRGEAWNDLENDYHKGDPAETTSDSFAGEYDIVPNVQANRAFFFYESGGETIYHSSSLLNLESSDKAVGDNHDDGYDNTEIYYSTTVKRTSDRGAQSWPTKCLIVLNGRPSRLNALTVKAQEETDFNLDKFLAWLNKDLKDTDAAGEGITLGLYTYNGKYYFTMSNSIFMDASETSKINATEIPASSLKLTREEAAENPITVYVERIMAKVEVGFTGYGNPKTTAIEHFDADMESPYQFIYDFSDSKEANSKWADNEDNELTGDEQHKTETLQALITNWTINAVEYQTYLFKQIESSWSSASTPFFSENNLWNDFRHHRSYWAKDSHYAWNEGKEYPTQYRQAFGGTATSYQPEDGWTYGQGTAETGGNDIFDDNYPWALDYKAFNAVTTKRKYKYCLENTFELADASLGYKHMIMGSHVLVLARLITKEEAEEVTKLPKTAGEEELDEVIKDKYYFSDSYYTESTYINSRVSRMTRTLGENVGDFKVDNLKMWHDPSDETEDKFTFEGIAGGLWVLDKDGKTYKQVVGKDEAGDNEIKATDVFCIAPAYVLKGDGKVTIALKDTYGSDTSGKFGYGETNVNLYYLKKNEVDEFGQPTLEDNKPIQLTRNKAVSLIYQVAGVGDCFKKGRMYYAVPIQHALAAGEGNKYEYKYEGLKTGEYGVVRNHWYKFTINTILKPGIPVHDPLQPIIPNYDDTDRYIGLQVVILPWHIVNNGNVTLGENK